MLFDSHVRVSPLTASFSGSRKRSFFVLWLTSSALSSGSDRNAGPPPNALRGDAGESARTAPPKNLDATPTATPVAATVPTTATTRDLNAGAEAIVTLRSRTQRSEKLGPCGRGVCDRVHYMQPRPATWISGTREPGKPESHSRVMRNSGLTIAAKDSGPDWRRRPLSDRIRARSVARRLTRLRRRILRPANSIPA